MLFEIVHDLLATAWFLHRVAKNGDACRRFHGSSKLTFGIPALRAGGVGDDKQSTTRIVQFQSFEVILHIFYESAVYENSGWQYLVRLINLVCIGIGEAVILIENHSLDTDSPAVSLQDFIKRQRQVGESRDCVMRETDARLEEQSQHVERC